MADYRNYTDDELTALLKTGDHRAFAAIYDRYQGVLFIHAMKMLRNEDEAKDLLQELFITLWSKSREIHVTGSLSAYLYASVRNKVFNYIEHQRVKRNYTSDIARFMEKGNFTTDEQVRLNELKRLIESEVAGLPVKMRQVFEMSRIGYLSHKEIASQLGISEKTVRKQVNNAIKILRLRLHLSMIFITAAVLHP